MDIALPLALARAADAASESLDGSDPNDLDILCNMGRVQAGDKGEVQDRSFARRLGFV